MNVLEIIEKYLTIDIIDQDLYLSRINGHTYKFIEPATTCYQGEYAWYQDLETGKKELIYGEDLKSLKREEPNEIMKYIRNKLKEGLE